MVRITTPELANAFIDEQIAAVKAQVGDKKVLLALSGGVDSSVVAALLIKAIGKQLVCVHVNHGLMRKGESEQVIEVFQNQLDANLIYIDATDRFLDLLAGVDAPDGEFAFVTNSISEKELAEKIKEALVSALPVTAIVYVLALTPLFNLSRTELITFTVGAVMLVLGIGLFSLGADLAMTPMGTHVGSGLSKQRKLGLLLGVCFVLGMLITIAEPDLQVLANQVSAVMNGTVLIYAVGLGVGAFLVIAILKIVFRRSLSQILMLFYMLLFALALMLVVSGNEALLPMGFDSGGVTTGPITVPFIMALGVGISNVLGDRRSKENSFGLVSLCSVGPILAVLILGIFSRNDLTYTVPDYTVSEDILGAFFHTAGHTCKEVAIALGLIVVFFMICQFAFLKLSVKHLKKIAVGVAFTYVGLVIFLTGVNVGFMPVGYKLGHTLGNGSEAFLIGFGLVCGVLTVLAEPAIHVLNAQVEDVTGGLVKKRHMMVGLCIGVGGE